jgi:hypothetical protein
VMLFNKAHIRVGIPLELSAATEVEGRPQDIYSNPKIPRHLEEFPRSLKVGIEKVSIHNVVMIFKDIAFDSSQEQINKDTRLVPQEVASNW